MAEEKRYYVKISGELVEVTEEVYLTYYRLRRRWAAQEERDMYNSLTSYNALDTKEMLGEETIPDYETPSVEDQVLDKLLRDKLQDALAQLSEDEQKMINTLYFEGLSERQAAKRFKLPPMTLHCRKVSILRKLKKLLKS